ncbi:uncharacterized protein BO97DRAFT_428969 [Aspergillus homomorphus CBS 101889]|uniref:Uncharacterized protein n=1 Tax=Aspergillus homomorphus (strain CBS 101889) TaxID=1450537 RepID=A0A395HJL6_ASPHC|nr:hypothetical protein BO97DRAFT_428969 [Aspergillus homomorphus CBS 101889]RAL07816.1 hypothetical protein BO97DRAFT_428969 [Aspergillus homomorphus CBS 101889]
MSDDCICVLFTTIGCAGTIAWLVLAVCAKMREFLYQRKVHSEYEVNIDIALCHFLEEYVGSIEENGEQVQLLEAQVKKLSERVAELEANEKTVHVTEVDEATFKAMEAGSDLDEYATVELL